LAKWAESKGIGDKFHRAVFNAYFVEGVNIAKIDELVRLSKTLGLPEEEVDSDWMRCHALGITAVPTFAVNHQKVVGFQTYETLEQLMK